MTTGSNVVVPVVLDEDMTRNLNRIELVTCRLKQTEWLHVA